MASITRGEAMKALKEMFPDLPTRVITAALFSHDGDVNDAAEWLLTEGVASPSVAGAGAVPVAASPPALAAAAAPGGTSFTNPVPPAPAAPVLRLSEVPPPQAPRSGQSNSLPAALGPPPPAPVTSSLMDAPMAPGLSPSSGPSPPASLDSFLFLSAPPNNAGSDGQVAAPVTAEVVGAPLSSVSGDVAEGKSVAGDAAAPCAAAPPEAAVHVTAAVPSSGQSLQVPGGGDGEESPETVSSEPSADEVSCLASQSALETNKVCEGVASLVPEKEKDEGKSTAAESAGVQPSDVAGKSEAGTPPDVGAGGKVVHAAGNESRFDTWLPAAGPSCTASLGPSLESGLAPVESQGDRQVLVEATEDGGVVGAGAAAAGGGPASQEASVGGSQSTDEAPAGWVVTSAQDARAPGPEVETAARVAEEKADDVPPGPEPEDDEEEPVTVEMGDTLSWSVCSQSILGSQMDISAFSPAGFDAILAKSSDLKADLRVGIQGVETLRRKLVEVQAEARQVEHSLESEKDNEQMQKERTDFMLQQARDEVENRSGEVDAEKACLHFEARNLTKRLTNLNTRKEALETEITELKEILSVRIREMEEKMRAAGDEMTLLMAQREERKRAEDVATAEIVARQEALDKEKARCSELKEFLADRGKTVDQVEGAIQQCDEDIKLLRDSILGMTDLSTPAEPSFEQLRLSVSSVQETGVPAQSEAGEFLNSSSRMEMREALQDMMSSSETSNAGASSGAQSSESSSPLYGSAAALATHPREAALEMLSLMKTSAVGNNRLSGPMGESSSARMGSSLAGHDEALSFVQSDYPVVSVVEGENEVPQEETAVEGAAGSATPGSTDKDDWEEVEPPQME